MTFKIEDRSKYDTPIQTRIYDEPAFVTRSVTVGDKIYNEIEGYASVTGNSYPVVDVAGKYMETIKPGAFTRSLESKPLVVFNFDHKGVPLASTSNGSLQLKEDDTGLWFRARVNPEMSRAKDISLLVEDGVVTDASVRFGIEDLDWSYNKAERTVNKANLNGGDVCVTSRGFNPLAKIVNRSCKLKDVNRFVDVVNTETSDFLSQKEARSLRYKLANTIYS